MTSSFTPPLVDELYSFALTQEADELCNRLYIPIRIPLTAEWDADNKAILKDYFETVKYFIEAVTPLLDIYLDDVIMSRSDKLRELKKPHDIADGEIFTSH